MSWSAYYEATLEKPVHPIYAELEPFLPERGVALELGCGVGHGVLWFLDHGFSVIANDGEEEALDIVRSRLPVGADVSFLPGRFEDIDLPRADVVVAGFSLFFLEPGAFRLFWTRLVDSMPAGAVFAGQFLGIHDDWAERGYTVHDAETLRQDLEGFEILHWEEAERDGETAMREPKHWHVFHVVARRK